MGRKLASSYGGDQPIQDHPLQTVPRRSERAMARIPVTLLADFRGRQLEGTASTVDVGQHGVKIQTDFPLSPDQPLILYQRLGELRPMCCRVAWARKSDSKRPREVGLEFLE